MLVTKMNLVENHEIEQNDLISYQIYSIHYKIMTTYSLYNIG